MIATGKKIVYDTPVTYRQRTHAVGTVAGGQSYSTAVSLNVLLKPQERWKASSDKIDIERVLVCECRYHAAINTSTTVINYGDKEYKVTSLEVIGRNQYLKITAIQDQK